MRLGYRAKWPCEYTKRTGDDIGDNIPPIIDTISGIIFIVMSAWPILAGCGGIRVSKNDAENARWRKKYGKLMIVCGGVVLATGILLIVY